MGYNIRKIAFSFGSIICCSNNTLKSMVVVSNFFKILYFRVWSDRFLKRKSIKKRRWFGKALSPTIRCNVDTDKIIITDTVRKLLHLSCYKKYFHAVGHSYWLNMKSIVLLCIISSALSQFNSTENTVTEDYSSNNTFSIHNVHYDTVVKLMAGMLFDAVKTVPKR